MGSTGTGRFTDYPGNPKPIKGVVGPNPKEDRCELAISTELEDVETSEYYNQYGKVPEQGSLVTIGFRKRIVAFSKEKLTIGSLPTKYNYLLGCIENGFNYTGEVEDSDDGCVPFIKIAVTPNLK